MFQLGSSEFRVTIIRDGVAETNPKIIIEMFEGASESKITELGKSGGYLGRVPGNEISIPEDQQVSSKHAHISYSNGKFYLNDEGSTNKTWVRLSGEAEKSNPFEILNGDVIKLGKSVFLIQANESIKSCSSISPVKSYNETPKGDEITKGGPSEKATNVRLCKVCFKNEANGVFIPCGHNCVCYECGKKCTECPDCKREVFETFQIYKH